MFDIGFAELIIIGVVALLVIGPERLPEAVRTASFYLNRLRRGFNEIKQEVQQELRNDAVMRDLRETGEHLKRETQGLKDSFETSSGTRSSSDSVPTSTSAPASPAADSSAQTSAPPQQPGQQAADKKAP
tara:strand:- start:2863 stop:3252 length:390 start_codon:yes stop_codon:yes gene_type:complete